MRIGIYTFFKGKDNYGQILQAYALQKFLKSLGHDVFLIDAASITYSSDKISERKHQTTNKIIKDFISKHIIRQYRTYIGKKFLKKYPRDFDSFRNAEFEISKEYKSFQDLQDNPPIADAYICGSDQVWNTGCTEKYSIAYLNFGSPEIIRIAYAPSFGRVRQSKEFVDFLSKQLSRFKAISVRENNGVELCRQAGRNDAIQVLDPTLLLSGEEYRKLYQNKQSLSIENYVYCYFLNIKKGKEVRWKQIQSFAETIDCKVKATLSTGMFPCMFQLGNIPYYSPNPTEWLQAIEQCQYFITNSFHGVVFSIIFHKPFLFMPFFGKTAFMNDRVLSLLTLLGLEKRMYSEKESIADQISSPIDWQMVETKLHSERSIALEFLHSALSQSE